jgi:hypothetical protein
VGTQKPPRELTIPKGGESRPSVAKADVRSWRTPQVGPLPTVPQRVASHAMKSNLPRSSRFGCGLRSIGRTMQNSAALSGAADRAAGGACAGRRKRRAGSSSGRPVVLHPITSRLRYQAYLARHPFPNDWVRAARACQRSPGPLHGNGFGERAFARVGIRFIDRQHFSLWHDECGGGWAPRLPLRRRW